MTTMTAPRAATVGAVGRKPRLVIAEDDAEFRRMLVDKFRGAGFDVVEADSGTTLAEFLVAQGGIDWSDAIISDVRMPGLSGMDMLAYLTARGYTKPVVLITAFGDWSIRREAATFGAVTVFDKPVDLDDLLQFVRQFLPPAGAAVA